MTTQQREFAKYRPESVAIVTTEVGNGLGVGFQIAQQPDHLDVARRFGFQSPPRANTVEIAVDLELQQIGRVIAWPPAAMGCSPSAPIGSPTAMQPIARFPAPMTGWRIAPRSSGGADAAPSHRIRQPSGNGNTLTPAEVPDELLNFIREILQADGSKQIQVEDLRQAYAKHMKGDFSTIRKSF